MGSFYEAIIAFIVLSRCMGNKNDCRSQRDPGRERRMTVGKAIELPGNHVLHKTKTVLNILDKQNI